jgi:hypothetical protein
MEGKWFSLGYYYPVTAWRKYQRLKCGLDDRGLEYWRKEMVFLLFVISYFIWAQHSLLLMSTRIYFLGGKKRPRREANPSPTSSADVKNY